MHILFETASLIDLNIVEDTRLAGQQAPRIRLCPLPLNWDCSNPSSLGRCFVSELRPLGLFGNHFTD